MVLATHRGHLVGLHASLRHGLPPPSAQAARELAHPHRHPGADHRRDARDRVLRIHHWALGNAVIELGIIWRDLAQPLPPFADLVRAHIQDPAAGRLEASRPQGDGDKESSASPSPK